MPFNSICFVIFAPVERRLCCIIRLVYSRHHWWHQNNWTVYWTVHSTKRDAGWSTPDVYELHAELWRRNAYYLRRYEFWRNALVYLYKSFSQTHTILDSFESSKRKFYNKILKSRHNDIFVFLMTKCKIIKFIVIFCMFSLVYVSCYLYF